MGLTSGQAAILERDWKHLSKSRSALLSWFKQLPASYLLGLPPTSPTFILYSEFSSDRSLFRSLLSLFSIGGERRTDAVVGKNEGKDCLRMGDLCLCLDRPLLWRREESESNSWQILLLQKKGKVWPGGGRRRGREGPPRALLERALWVFNEAFLLCKPNCTAAWGSRVF